MDHIMLIDDDVAVLTITKKYLTTEGYQVCAISDAQLVLEELKTFQPNCIVLDVTMPGINGFELCKQIRAVTTTPIIFLTGLPSEDDKVKGLYLEADDYMVKPYSLRELNARINANIRKHQTVVNSSILLSFPPLSIDQLNHKVFYNTEEIPLSNREYDFLVLLATSPNTLITFEQISIKMWGTYSEQDQYSIMVNVSSIRKKFDNFLGLSNSIETVCSLGYRFISKYATS